MDEKDYVIYKNYRLTLEEPMEEIIRKCAQMAYLEFCRQVQVQSIIPNEEGRRLEIKTERLLSKKICEDILYDMDKIVNQNAFDEVHYRICKSIIELYREEVEIPYGMAQMWLNYTILNYLLVVAVGDDVTDDTEKLRSLTHFPAEKRTLEAANSVKGRFKHSLGMQGIVPKDMNWDDKQCVLWSYEEYINYQVAVREKLKEYWGERLKIYKEPIEWFMRAKVEVERRKKRY